MEPREKSSSGEPLPFWKGSLQQKWRQMYHPIAEAISQMPVLSDKHESLMRKMHELAANEQKMSQKNTELLYYIDMFSELLGIEIRRLQGERLQFILWNIDARDPKRTFGFTWYFPVDGGLEVLDIHPNLPAMPVLMEKLKETKNFRLFFLRVRKAFQASL
uniref:Kinetochore protein SPC25 n=1 Tax=Eptatretus burgeri TaxID=7764 RepID=A0A8C4PY08_EPTBU